MSSIFAFAEARDGKIRKVAFEVVTAARRLADETGGEVHAVILGGPGLEDDAAELGKYGADRIVIGESEAFVHYSAEGYTNAVVDFLKANDCDVALFPASAMGKDLAPRVAAKMGVGYAAECTAIESDGDSVKATRPLYAGKVSSRVAFTGKPAIVSLRANVFTPVESARDAEVEKLDVGAGSTDFGGIVREIRAAAGEKLDVTEAPIVVSGGRGLREPENFKMLEDLADALGAAVGASRAVVDAGWRPHAEQVGQTGKTVSPTLYFAIGISGAIQHLAGMRTSRYIVAINKDPEAPIFKVADYGIVGDLFEIVPRLTEEIRKMR
ncbi:MAG TPA: electron transfer flavoprotein subunit alpha/FixB family protein [Longimicrobiaceae bacterium]|nr:electron transfer flavoprotein subunit alpha/FixB family protein [Longimicrobiaceae bacterium]